MQVASQDCFQTLVCFNETPTKSVSFTPGKTDTGGCGDFSGKSPAVYCIPNPLVKPKVEPNSNFYNGYSETNGQLPNNRINGNPTKKPDLHYVMDRFASNEFTEEEYNDWLIKKRKMDESKSSSEEMKTPERSKDFWWMYEGRPALNNASVNTANNSGTTTTTTSNSQPTGPPTGPPAQETCMPCGFCKCCSAISNYVHIFGEVPENIQVYDFVEEVFEAEEQACDNVIEFQ